MNCSKMISICKVAGGIAVFIGFFLMVGSVGSSDLAVEMGIYEPLYAHMGTMLFGLILMGIGVFVTSLFDTDFEEESEEDFND